MAQVKFKRINDSTQINTIPVSDGNFIVTKDGKTYIDFGNDRINPGITTDSSMSDSSRNAVENAVIKSYVDKAIADLRGEIVWTNPNPDTSFSAQTIRLDKAFSEGFDSYEILYKQNSNASNTRLMTTGIIPSSNGTILNYCTTTNNFRATGTTIYDQTLTFEDGNPTNDICIPMYVILHKTGLF